MITLKPKFERLGLLLLFTFPFLSVCDVLAQNKELNINVETPGELAEQIGENKYETTSLVVRGSLNGDDILFIREMAGRDIENNPTEGKLSVLDMSEANIVEGGGAYFMNYYEYKTENNVIGEHMFEKSTITSLKVPSNITTIKSYSFQGSNLLEVLEIPTTVSSLGNAAFKDCSSLKEFVCPEVTKIGGEMFSGCSGLVEISIPASVVEIDYMAFANCTAMRNMYVGAEKAPTVGYNAFKNVNFDECKLYVPTGSAALYGSADQWNQFKNIMEGGGVVEPEHVFVEQPGTLPMLIGDRKFSIMDLTVEGNLNGTDISLIREMAGRDSRGEATAGILTRLDMSGANIVEGGDPYYYSYNQGLYTTNDEMSNYFFCNLALETLILPNSLKIIEGGALSGCSSLKGVLVIPEGVTRIGNYAFEACMNLEGVKLPSTMKEGTGSTYYKDAIGSNAFYGCHSLKSIDIPENVVTINSNTFMDCYELATVSLPSTLTAVKDGAFKNCSGIKSISVSATEPPSVGYETFYNLNTSECELHVPVGSLDLYKNANGWKDFMNIYEDIPTDISNVPALDGGDIEILPDGIMVTGSKGSRVYVYTMAGMLCKEAVCNGSVQMSLAPGAYIVKICDKTFKVVVR